jgi:hypothetical protein
VLCSCGVFDGTRRGKTSGGQLDVIAHARPAVVVWKLGSALLSTVLESSARARFFSSFCRLSSLRLRSGALQSAASMEKSGSYLGARTIRSAWAQGVAVRWLPMISDQFSPGCMSGCMRATLSGLVEYSASLPLGQA